MTKDEMQQIRDTLSAMTEASLHHPTRWKGIDAIEILDAELAAPEQEPVGCKHNRYSVDVHEQIGNCLDCGAEGHMRFVVDGTAPPDHYDQTALELCEVCGWKTLIPGDCCLNCERGKVEQEPVPAPQRETNVVEALRRCLDELKGHNDSPYCDFRDSFNDIMEQAESALGAKNVDRAPHARDAVAWMPDTGYVFAPDKNTAPAAAPQREWQELTVEQKQALLWEADMNLHYYQFEKIYNVLSKALRTKNEEKPS